MTAMTADELCEIGSEQLWAMQYVKCIATLEQAEQLAWDAQDWDLLSRLYMPLQEARRQVRQRCGEGTVRLDLLQTSPDRPLDVERIVQKYPHGQLLIGGLASLEPAVRVRQLARERQLYLETFLAAVYRVGDGLAVVIAPTQSVKLPPPIDGPIDLLIRQLPPHCIVLADREIPAGQTVGTPDTYAGVMNFWEQLHRPFLAMADATVDPVQRMIGYRQTIGVDSACELAHQRLSKTAHGLARQQG